MNVNRRILLSTVVGLLLVASYITVAAPEAAAQEGCSPPNQVRAVLQFEGRSADPNIRPLGGAETLNFRVVYGAQQTGVPGIAVTGPTQIDIGQTVDKEDWMSSVTITPTTVFMEVDPQSGPQQGPEVSVAVALSDDAPALESGNLEISIDAQANGDVCASSTTVSWSITPEYYEVTSFTAPALFNRGPPSQKLSFPLTVINNGNGQTYYQFEVTKQPEGWEIPLPFPQTVTSQFKASEGSPNQQTVTLDVSTQLSTQYYNDIGVVNLKVAPAFAPDKSIAGTDITLSLVGHFQGVYVPGFGAPMALAALAAVGLLARRRDLFG